MKRGLQEQVELSQEVHRQGEQLALAQKMGLHALTTQLQNIRLKEILFMSGMSIGSGLLRVPMQIVPSAEPISFFAFLAGWLFGRTKGFLVGASALYISNFFVMGGQGPWTLFQLVGFGAIGFAGGFLRKKATLFEILPLMLLATVLFEFIMNVQASMFFGFNLLVSFITAIPFSLTHIISNLVFATLLPLAYRLANKGGGFHEKDLCQRLIRRLKRQNKDIWLIPFKNGNRIARFINNKCHPMR